MLSLMSDDVRQKLESWQDELRQYTRDESIVLFATSKSKTVEKGMPIEDLAEIVSHSSEIPVDKIRGKNRNRTIVLARQLIYQYAPDLCKVSLEDVGLFLGGRDHSTVSHGRLALKALLDTKDDRAVELVNKFQYYLQEVLLRTQDQN